MNRKTREDVRLFAYLLKCLSTAKLTIVIFFEVNPSCNTTSIELFKLSVNIIALSEEVPQLKKASPSYILSCSIFYLNEKEDYRRNLILRIFTEMS